MNASSPIDAVVVTHDSAESLPSCLAALSGEGVPAIVVDNASRDASADIAERAGARVVRLARNEGYGRANNAGVAASDAEFVLIANPDLVLDEGAAAALLAAAGAYPDAAMFAPRIVEEDGRFFFQSRSLLSTFLINPAGVACRPEGDCCAPFLSGACLLIRREVLSLHRRLRSGDLPVLRGRRSVPARLGRGACARPCP